MTMIIKWFLCISLRQCDIYRKVRRRHTWCLLVSLFHSHFHSRSQCASFFSISEHKSSDAINTTQSDICKELKLSYMVKTTSPPTATAAPIFFFFIYFGMCSTELTNFHACMYILKSHSHRHRHTYFIVISADSVESQNC